ncbi:MAG: NACHT domain-containing protein [Cyanobacteria bacterium P01_D01_bin.36]
MEPITSASAIVGLIGAITDQAIRAGGYAHKEIKAAYTGVQAEQKKLAAAQNYIRRYDQRHCQVKVMPGLMKEPLPLEEIYTAVKLLDDQSIRYFVGLNDLEETYRKKGHRSFGRGEGERQDGMAVANAEQYLMVLGGPGIGKSTFLRKIGLEALKAQSDNTKQIHRDCIPVLIELKELRGETVDLKQKIADEFATCGFPEAAAFTEASLAQGKLFVLLDGLDEVPTRNLNTVIKHIEDFVDAHDQNAFVASCRIAAYRSSQGIFFHRFTDVTLAEFDDEQIEQFVRRWFRSQLDQEAGTADRYWKLLQKNEHKATKELAQTPLLLTFLCLVYDREQTLPAQRSTLYGKALNILLSEWAAQKRLEQDPIYEGFHPDLEKVLLAEIAYDSFKNDQLFFHKNDLTRRISAFLADTLDAPKHLDGAKVLQAIERQQGILVERATDIYSFSHLTLQEYLTAFHMVEARLEDELIAQHLTDERWREVFLLVSGLSGNRAISLLNHLDDQSQNYVASVPKLRELISWAMKSTNGAKGNYEPIVKRAVAIAIAIIRPSTSKNTITSDSTSAIAIAIARAINSDIDRNSALTAPSPVPALEPSPEPSLALYTALEPSTTSVPTSAPLPATAPAPVPAPSQKFLKVLNLQHCQSACGNLLTRFLMTRTQGRCGKPGLMT